MYGIPGDFDLSPIVGQMIDSITLGPYTLHIAFGGGLTITCEGTVEYRDGTGIAAIWDRQWQDLNLIKHLLGASVSSWQVESDRVFSVSLQDAGTLVFTDDSTQYESFQIGPDKWII